MRASDLDPARGVPRDFAGMPGARLLFCVALFCMTNAVFWGPALADVFGGMFAASVPVDFANRDFANYWLSGRLVLSGDLPVLASKSEYQAALETAFGLQGMEPRNWSYPPHLLLLTWPLGFLSYPAAYALFMAVTGGWFILAVRQAAERITGDRDASFRLAVLLLVPFFCAQLLAGQNGFLFGAAMLQALMWRRTRPVAAGLLFAVLTMKPQLGLLVPVLLLAEKRFDTIAWTVLFTGILMGVSALVFGPGVWQVFFESTLPYQQYVAAHWQGQFLYMMPTWFGAFRATGMAHEPALALHMALAAPLMIAGLVALVRAPDSETRTRILLVSTFVLTPYAFSYDAGAVLALAALDLGSREASRHSSWGLAIGGGLVMALPLWMPLLGRPDELLLLPPALMSGLLICWAAPALAPIWQTLASRVRRVP